MRQGSLEQCQIEGFAETPGKSSRVTGNFFVFPSWRVSRKKEVVQSPQCEISVQCMMRCRGCGGSQQVILDGKHARLLSHVAECQQYDDD